LRSISEKLVNLLRQLCPSVEELRFIRHNQKTWESPIDRVKGEVLFELNGMHSAIIAYSYLANVLASRYESKLVTYSFGQSGRKTLSALWRTPIEKIFSSFGTASVLRPSLTKSQKKRSKMLFLEVYSSLKTKRDVEDITLDDVWIGDLVYDSFLRENSVPSIDLNDENFARSLARSLEIYVYWRDYMDLHNVRAINVSHCVYNLAIPLRIAISRGIPVFQTNASHLYRLNRKKLFAYNDFFEFPDTFRTLPVEVQTAGLAKAKERIELRFSGGVGVDMGYSSKSAFGEYKSLRLLKATDRTKVLIATHCFFDSPHSYGRNLFPDFFEWLDFLGKMTLEVDYDWYIKTHPDYLAGTKEIIDSFVSKYPKFQLLPSDSSHHQIIEEGIDVVLTTYGTIGFEYAALGVPVVNASVNNPHIAYNFNIHPKSIDEYREVIKNLDHIELKIDINELYEYYFMKHIYNTNDWLFEHYDQMVDELGGYAGQFTPSVYSYWLREWTPARHAEIIAALECFIESEDFRLVNRHLGRDFKLGREA